MKIAIVGCGAVGSFYGAKLCQAEKKTHFLLRSDYDAVRARGVSILSPEGDFTVHPQCARRPEEIGPSDLVLIGLKTTANDQLEKLLPPLVGESTAVLSLQNGLGNMEILAGMVPSRQLLGGLCFVCLNRVEPGVIRHLGYGMIEAGEFQRPAGPRTHAIAEMFRNAGVPCRVTDDLARAQWEKLLWNIPFNGLGVAAAAGYGAFAAPHGNRGAQVKGSCLTTDKLLADPRWEGLVREVMLEVVHAAHALGFAIPESLAEKQIERTRTMGAYKASTVLDFEQGRPLELENLFLEPLRRARAAGASVPRLARMCEILSRFSRTYSGIRISDKKNDPGSGRQGGGGGEPR